MSRSWTWQRVSSATSDGGPCQPYQGEPKRPGTGSTGTAPASQTTDWTPGGCGVRLGLGLLSLGFL